MTKFISYDGLPISSGGGHHVSAQSADVVYEKVNRFLATYTDVVTPTRIQIGLEKFNIGKIIKLSKFGIPTFDLSNLIASGTFLTYWNVSHKRLDEAIQIASTDNDTTILVVWKFNFIDIETREVLSGQNEIPIIDERLSNSQLLMRFSKDKKTISVWFTFPFNNLNEKNLEYIEGIKSILPFKFSSKTWRMWSLSKNNKWIPKVLDF